MMMMIITINLWMIDVYDVMSQMMGRWEEPIYITLHSIYNILMRARVILGQKTRNCYVMTL